MELSYRFDTLQPSLTEKPSVENPSKDKIVAPLEAYAKIASVGEPLPSDVQRLLDNVFEKTICVHTSESYIADISPAREVYDILITYGADPQRLIKLLKAYLPTLGLIPKIAVVEAAMPKERARLLNAGFDDVVPPKITPAELSARCTAIITRYAHKRIKTSTPYSRHSLFEFSEAALTEREAMVLSLLARNSPAPVPHAILRGRNSPLRQVRVSSLRVIVSNLRAKIKPHFKIEFNSIGYSLIPERETL